ncbi:DNA processing protein [Stackebrandtia albiflava]|uniref:DNA processing protein n=1 Tax=Stackebrandtia albiflava TaxID=406432 RepID=A0A562VAE5_9ACTN|nr:DNA-processing protein DprA [Stackebrandtia albiflava]TWJ14852.1 DNA processing protein [Stackebrandtia albiflava]
MTPEHRALVALSMLYEPGNALVGDDVARFGPADALHRLVSGASDAGLAAAARQRLGDRDPDELVRSVLPAAEACGARPVTPLDPEWPARVADLAGLYDESDPHTRPPLCLWVRGEGHLAELTDRSVAVVGARVCTEYGRHVATEFGYGLTRQGWTVVSGGAYGIDAAAHTGALAAGGGTVCVLAGGVDREYPARLLPLFDRIRRNGLLVSEWPPGATPRRFRFLVRNRVIAAMPRGTVVVEAGLRSGARHTARLAAELDRPVMVVPGPVNSRASAGVHQLARGHHPVRIVTRAADVVEDLGGCDTALAPAPAREQRPRDRLGEVAARVLDSVPRSAPATVERIAAQAGVSAAAAQRVLPALVAAGLARCEEGRYRLPERI